MEDPGLAGGSSPHVSGPLHGLPRIRTNRPASAESGSGMDGLLNGHPTLHELPCTDRDQNGYGVDIDSVEANEGSPSREPLSTAGSARTGAGYMVDYPEGANEYRPVRRWRRRRMLARTNPFRIPPRDGYWVDYPEEAKNYHPVRRWRRHRRLARMNPFRIPPREYPHVSVTFSSDPENTEGNQSRLLDDLVSYEFATKALLFATGLANLHPRTRGRWFPALAVRYAREPDVELSIGFEVSEEAPRWEWVDQGLLQVTRREVLENLRVAVGGDHGPTHHFDDSALYDVHEVSVTQSADRDA